MSRSEHKLRSWLRKYKNPPGVRLRSRMSIKATLAKTRLNKQIKQESSSRWSNIRKPREDSFCYRGAGLSSEPSAGSDAFDDWLATTSGSPKRSKAGIGSHSSHSCWLMWD